MSHLRVCMVVTLAACGVRGNGQEASDVRVPGAFDAVENSMNIDVEVVVGEVAEVVVTCDENLLDLIHTEVKDGWLQVRTDVARSIRPEAPCYASVTAPVLKGVAASGSGAATATGDLFDLVDVHASGSGSVTAEGVEHGRAIDLDTSGSGKLYVTGSAGTATCSASGSGDIRAKGLTVQDATIRGSGSGSVELTVTGEADVNLSGSGDAVVFGGAQVSQKTSGSGDVVVR